MPKLSTNQFPSYRLHRQSGQAVVTLNGRDHCLGKYDTPESREKYDRVIAGWLARGRRLADSREDGITVVELINAFRKNAERYYCHPDGTPTSEQENFRQALRPLRHLY